ncbi:hypothetical protein J6590_012060 [Homalodisca vitripennis]|nr:hypothetical protein J6590_012060 [Homalodisca vitripennis]
MKKKSDREAAQESPAIEVLEYRKKHGVKDKTIKIHDMRSPGLWFRVGQVVQHIYEGYKGVIIEWEFDSKSSSTPMYKVLVDEDTTDENFSSVVNVVQDQLYLLKNTKQLTEQLAEILRRKSISAQSQNFKDNVSLASIPFSGWSTRENKLFRQVVNGLATEVSMPTAESLPTFLLYFHS